MTASFAETWAHETNFGFGIPLASFFSSYTPNSLINTSDSRNAYRNWQGKLNVSLPLSWGVRLNRVSGTNQARRTERTFVAALNYGNATLSQSRSARGASSNVNLLDIRAEKRVSFGTLLKVAGFVDVYNVFNSNAAYVVTSNSGANFLRPIAVTPPRMARLAIKVDW